MPGGVDKAEPGRAGACDLRAQKPADRGVLAQTPPATASSSERWLRRQPANIPTAAPGALLLWRALLLAQPAITANSLSESLRRPGRRCRRTFARPPIRPSSTLRRCLDDAPAGTLHRRSGYPIQRNLPKCTASAIPARRADAEEPQPLPMGIWFSMSRASGCTGLPSACRTSR